MTLSRSLLALILTAGRLAAVAAVGAPAAPGRPTIPPTPPDVAAKMSVLFAKASPAVRAWVDAEARKLRPMPKIDLPMVAADARQRFASAVPPLTPAQADVLAAMALYQTAKDVESAVAMRDGLRDAKNSLGELNKQDIFFLQQAMDQKNQLEAMISNVMRSFSDGAQAIIGNLK
jgi:hypothetical protein